MDPLEGVLHTDRLDRFCRRFGLRRVDLEANFDGWHKRVILSPDSAYLFPRHGEDIPQIEREAAALRELADVALVPPLIGAWNEPDISPDPFLQTERRFGTAYDDLQDDLTLDEVGRFLERLGEATARWHAVRTDGLPPVLRSVEGAYGWRGVSLDAATLRANLETAADQLAAILPDELAPRRSWVDPWHAMLLPLAELELVFTHGDVHETQLLVDDNLELVAVLDWDHAGLGHPVRDFNFGEWGFGIFSLEERFDVLYERYWESYRRARDVELPDHRALLLYRVISDALWALDALASEPASWWSAHRLRNCALHIRTVTDAGL